MNDRACSRSVGKRPAPATTSSTVIWRRSARSQRGLPVACDQHAVRPTPDSRSVRECSPLTALTKGDCTYHSHQSSLHPLDIADTAITAVNQSIFAAYQQVRSHLLKQPPQWSKNSMALLSRSQRGSRKAEAFPSALVGRVGQAGTLLVPKSRNVQFFESSGSPGAW